jgi:uncharacterized protein
LRGLVGRKINFFNPILSSIFAETTLLLFASIMTKEIWINLPVKDVVESCAFFTAIGFIENTKYPKTPHSASLFIGEKKTVLMLFQSDVFKTLTGTAVSDTQTSSSVLFSFDTSSRDETDELAKKVVAAGGTLFAKPAEVQGWMYGFGFCDLDGHRWNALFMDMNKIPQG